MNHSALRAIRDSLISASRERMEAPQIVDRYLTEFVHQIEAEMERTMTVFYQP